MNRVWRAYWCGLTCGIALGVLFSGGLSLWQRAACGAVVFIASSMSGVSWSRPPWKRDDS